MKKILTFALRVCSICLVLSDQTYSRHKTFKNVPILSGTTFDIGVPFTYNLPNSTASLVYTGRKMEDEHSAVFEMAEDLLNK